MSRMTWPPMIRPLLILMMMLAPAMAAAGPWPREVGRTFLSMTVERDVEGSSYTSLYAEYGLAPRLTLGADLGRTDLGEASAVIWAQRALDDGTGPNRFSLATGLGAIRRDGRFHPVAQGSLGWGRGFANRMGEGWMSAQVQVRVTGGMDPEASTGSAFRITDSTLKTDLTLGLRPTDRLMVINSLWLEAPREGRGTAKLASSVVMDPGGPIKVELGLVQPLHGPAERAVRLGGWLEF